MTDDYLKWLKGIIADNNVHAFYNSPEWKKKQAEILKKQNHECQRCKSKGLYTRAVTVHHRKYLRRYPYLALEDSNLESICRICHNQEHKKKENTGFINQERW